MSEICKSSNSPSPYPYIQSIYHQCLLPLLLSHLPCPPHYHFPALQHSHLWPKDCSHLLTRHSDSILIPLPSHDTPFHLPFSCQKEYPIHKSNWVMLLLQIISWFRITETTKTWLFFFKPWLLNRAFRSLHGLPQAHLTTLSLSVALFASSYESTCNPTMLLASGNLHMLFFLLRMPFSLAPLVNYFKCHLFIKVFLDEASSPR